MTSRLWFRLDEILPIAEHALACPAHRLTNAQLLAGQPLRPALVWERDDGEDTMSSNGVPVWCDSDGSPHTARVWTWQHHGQRGTVGLWQRADPRDRYLPLHHHHGPLTVLREGAAGGGHWFVFDTDPQLAANLDRFAVCDNRDEIAPPDARWVDATVTAAAVAHGNYPARIADGYSVDGDDVLARFDRATVEAMAADLRIGSVDAMPGEHPTLRLEQQVLVVLWEHDDGIDTRLVETDRVYSDQDGMYAVGAYLWPWTRTDPR